jgi:hypothetical protein
VSWKADSNENLLPQLDKTNYERGTAPGPLFGSRQGRLGISRFRLDQLMKEYCDAAGIRKEKAHMQVLKNSCHTDLAEGGNAADTMRDSVGSGYDFQF